MTTLFLMEIDVLGIAYLFKFASTLVLEPLSVVAYTIFVKKKKVTQGILSFSFLFFLSLFNYIIYFNSTKHISLL